MDTYEFASTFDAIEQAVEKNDELMADMVAIQRKAQLEGWPREKYADKLHVRLAEDGIDASPEALLRMVRDAGTELSDDEVDEVAGGAYGVKSCNKEKKCPGGTGRSCYPHC